MTILIFNPHSPYGERLLLADLKTKRHTFQSTLPMRGATAAGKFILIHDGQFQSTLPMRGATVIQQLAPIISQISIHTPHAGSDR